MQEVKSNNNQTKYAGALIPEVFLFTSNILHLINFWHLTFYFLLLAACISLLTAV